MNKNISYENTHEKYRSQAADVTKGIAIMVIVLAHSKLRDDMDAFVSAMGLVSIPLFFFLSGVFLNTEHSFGKFLLKKTDVLLKPYFVTLFLYGLVTHIFYLRLYPVSDLMGALYGTGQSNPWVWVPMWYLPITWLTLLSAFILFKYLKFSNWPMALKFVFPVCCFAIGAFFIDYFWKNSFVIGGERYHFRGLPFSSDLLPLSLSFLFVGAILKDKVKHFSPSLLLMVISGITFLLIINMVDIKLDMNRRIFRNPLMGFFAIIAGAYFLFSIAYFISLQPRLAKLFIVLGRATLFILIFHLISYQLFIEFFGRDFKRHFDMFYFYLALYPISIIIPLLLKEIAKRVVLLKYLYLPVIK